MDKIQLSVVIPCLNEATTIQQVVEEALVGAAHAGVSVEVIVADNGSTDGSGALAETAGARVIYVKKRGYGAALRAGLAVAKGDLLVIGDGDATYDFRELPTLLNLQRDYQYDFVSGNRLNNALDARAMRWLHRHVGTPTISLLMRGLFGLRINDSTSGLRLFTRRAYKQIRPSSIGMDFSSEMLARVAWSKLHTGEVDICYRPRPDGSEAKLSTWSDGWRLFRTMVKFRLNPALFAEALEPIEGEDWYE